MCPKHKSQRFYYCARFLPAYTVTSFNDYLFVCRCVPRRIFVFNQDYDFVVFLAKLYIHSPLPWRLGVYEMKARRIVFTYVTVSKSLLRCYNFRGLWRFLNCETVCLNTYIVPYAVCVWNKTDRISRQNNTIKSVNSV